MVTVAAREPVKGKLIILSEEDVARLKEAEQKDDAPPEEVRGVVQAHGRVVGSSIKGLQSQGRVIR